MILHSSDLNTENISQDGDGRWGYSYIWLFY